MHQLIRPVYFKAFPAKRDALLSTESSSCGSLEFISSQSDLGAGESEQWYVNERSLVILCFQQKAD